MRRGFEFEPEDFPDRGSSEQERIGDIHDQADEVLRQYLLKRNNRRRVIGEVVGGGIMFVATAGFLMRDAIGNALSSFTCYSLEKTLAAIEEAERRAEWRNAAYTAEFGLQKGDVCAEDRVQIGRRYAANSLEILFENQPHPSDMAAQERIVAQYARLKSAVSRYGLPSSVFPSKMQTAKRAYQAQEFLLAKQVLDEAFYRGELNVKNKENMRFAYSTWRNAGYWMLESRDPEYRDRGIRILVGAHTIDTNYQLVSGVARSDLIAYAGADQTKWPLPEDHPLLTSPATPTPTVLYGRRPGLEVRTTDSRR